MATVLHKMKLLSTELRGVEVMFSSYYIGRCVCVCVALPYRAFSGGQPSLPADVYESRRDDDHADRADDHQDHKQLAVVAAGLTRPRLTGAGGAVVLDAHLRHRVVMVSNDPDELPARRYQGGADHRQNQTEQTQLNVRGVTSNCTSFKFCRISPSIPSTSCVDITPGGRDTRENTVIAYDGSNTNITQTM